MGPTCIFWANLTPFSLQRSASEESDISSGETPAEEISPDVASFISPRFGGSPKTPGSAMRRPGMLTQGGRGAARPPWPADPKSDTSPLSAEFVWDLMEGTHRGPLAPWLSGNYHAP
jgi:hypothetical protein